MKLDFILDDALELDTQLVCVALSEMFSLGIEFEENTVTLEGDPADILCWIAFNILPLENIEA
jgi:hypothetical protein